MSTALSNPVSLEEIEQIRSNAIELFRKSKAMHDEAHNLVSRAVRIISGTDVDYEVKFNFDRREFDFNEQRIENFTKGFDKSIWQSVYSTLNLSKIMDAQAKAEFRETLDTNPIPATADNLRSTVNHLQEDGFLIFQRGLVNAFAALDRRFKSHDGFKIGSRLIFKSYFSMWSSCSTSREKLNDVERVFYTLDGKEQPTLSYRPTKYVDGKSVKDMDAELNFHGMMDEATNWDTIETPYFRGRRFANGNLHLWMCRDDLVRKANLLLADFYGEVLGARSEVCNPEDIGPDYLPTLVKDLAFYPTPSNVIDRMLDGRPYIEENDRILEPSAGNGDIVDAIRNLYYVKERNINVDFQTYELNANRAATLKGKGYKVKQADFLSIKPTRSYDKVFMNPPFTRSRDLDHVTHALKFLKPGGTLIAVMSARAELSHDARHVAFRGLLKRTTTPLGYRTEFGFSDLPALSFKSAGTNANTVLLQVRLNP